MRLSDLISMVVDCDIINIQDSTGSLYGGECKDFKATKEINEELLDRKVDCVRPYKNCLIILLGD